MYACFYLPSSRSRYANRIWHLLTYTVFISYHMAPVPAVPLRVGADNVTPVSSVRDLGVYLDADASMMTHISRTAASCFGILRQLRSVQRSLPRHAVVSIVTSLVLTKLDYCNSLLVGLPPKLLTTPGRRHQHSSSFGLSCYEGRSHYTCVERPTLATNPGKDPVQAMYPCVQVLT